MEKNTKNTVNDSKDITTMINSVSYTVLPSGKTTICELVLRTGFVVIGISTCVDIKNYNKELGEKLSYEDAIRKLQEFAAYELASEISSIRLPLSNKKWKKPKQSN